MKMEMKANERFMTVLRGESVDRMPLFELAPWWPATIDRWRGEGLPADLVDGIDIQDHFGLDLNVMWWFHPFTESTPRPKEHGAGRCIDEEDYVKNLRPTLYKESVIPDWFIKRAKDEQAKGKAVTWFYINGPFWEPREYLGIERHLLSFYDTPELYEMMVADMLEWQEKVIEYAVNTLDFDFINIAEDMSYNLGSMIGKETFDAFIAPYYKKLTPILKKAGLFCVVDSDGDIFDATGWYRGVGAQVMWPLERQAGIDLTKYQDAYPDMAFVGHYDKMALIKGEAAMRAEFERLLPIAQRGRYVLSVDHQTPPDVSLTNYKIYLKLLREYAPHMHK